MHRLDPMGGAVAVFLIVLAGCESGRTESVNGTTTELPSEPQLPAVHRAEAVNCDAIRADQLSCDLECGEDGRCASSNGGEVDWCSYDECFGDADCGPGEVCECEGGFNSDNNVCVASLCRTDADCGDQFCSPSFGECGYYEGIVGYFCHTSDDECVDDSDCDDFSEAGDRAYCKYDMGVGHWLCSDYGCNG